jgi:hypothetical protein
MWPPRLVAALYLLAAASFFALGMRDVIRAFARRSSDPDQPGDSTPSG